MKKIGVILSGCGYIDGAEIQEAVLTLLAIDRAGAEAVCFAPDIPQYHVVNHLTGQPVPGESRNVLVESARIARGAVTDLKKIDIADLDALIIPGGFGAAKNLCDYAFKGAALEVNPDVADAVNSFFNAGKPVGFMCISPVIAAKVLGREQIELTIGDDPATAGDIEALGARHVICPVGNTVVSEGKKVVSTPAYMLGPGVADVWKGIEKLVGEVLGLL
ncbi:MAG: isoprenoid biosynthesis glyoxalase ElbB [Chlorobiaceae bacterium]|nr:isoprenoid biosynthesis glyoxalase ElbB [Chlorobiaceae bacterium]NTV61890.1 isoprenoid biosynthesis glyoxalase ElbB [Chlorobiaceae bacterium]